MENLNIAFDEYINEVKKLDIISKREELINSIKDLISTIQFLADSQNIELEYIRSKEIFDIDNIDVSEDDFIKSALVCVEIAKNLIGDYLDKKN